MRLEENDKIKNILSSVKDAVGISVDYDQFDSQILLYINSSMAVLTQIGVGPAVGFNVDGSTSWDEFSSDIVLINLVKNYLVIGAQIKFDSESKPSSVLQSLENQKKEIEWRLYTWVESEDAFKEVDK